MNRRDEGFMWVGPLRDEWRNRGCFLKARTMRQVYERIDNNSPDPYYFAKSD